MLKNASVLFDASGLLESDLAVTQASGDVTETVAGKPVTEDGQDERMQAAVAAAKGEAAADEELLDWTLQLLNDHIRLHSTTLLRYDGGEKTQRLWCHILHPNPTGPCSGQSCEPGLT